LPDPDLRSIIVPSTTELTQATAIGVLFFDAPPPDSPTSSAKIGEKVLAAEA